MLKVLEFFLIHIAALFVVKKGFIQYES